MKKMLSTLLAIVMLLTLAAPALAKETYTIVSYQNSNQGRQPDENDDILKVLEEKLKGKGYVEIAQILGRSPKSIDNTLQRIRKKILAYLEE